MTVYPIMLNVKKMVCLIVGGGRVAERKASHLLEAGADVLLISPELSSGLNELVNKGRIRLERRKYEEGDIRRFEPLLVFAATNEPRVNQAVIEEARQAGKLVNAADNPDAGSFCVPAVLKRGKLAIAVSTGGAGPAAAARIKRELAGMYGPEYETYLDFLGQFRKWLRERIPSSEERHELLKIVQSWPLDSVIVNGRFDSWVQGFYRHLDEGISGENLDQYAAATGIQSFIGSCRTDSCHTKEHG
ncbi:bifunctional precorrin-2 dehydrogenase/sirohydrochlorin ferrochelatase [Paenibacillus larvae]